MVDSPLNPNANASGVSSMQTGVAALSAPQYSPEFLKADSFMAQLAGDKIPQSLRYQYWQELDGDKLAKHDPRAAAIAYDTAIMVNPQAAFNLVKQTKGDPTKMYQLRNTYAEQMIAKDPTKYGGMAESWKNYTANQGRALGLVPADDLIAKRPNTPLSVPPGDLIDQRPNTPSTVPAGEVKQPLSSAAAPSATPAANRDAMVNNIMRTIRGGESGGKYGITSFAEGKGSTASGGYQFSDSTWREQARKLGGEATKYSRAKDAPQAIQDAVAKNYVSDILRRNNDHPESVFKEWYGGPKGYLTPQELAVNKGLTMDKYLAGRMASYNKIAGGQAGPEQVAADQGATQPEKPATPEKSAFEQAADSVSAGISGAGEAKKPEAAPAIPITKPNIPLPPGPIAPAQRDMYARALDAISKRNASTPPTQPAKPADVQEKAAPAASTPEPTPEKEVATPQ